MIIVGSSLVIKGSDLSFSVPLIDEDGNAIVSGQTCEISIWRESDSKYWNDASGAFDLTSEPTLISAPKLIIDSVNQGIYTYDLSAGYDGTSANYVVHIETVGTVNYNFTQPVQVSSEDADVAAIKAKTDLLTFSGTDLNSNLTKIENSATIDTETITKAFELMVGLVNGKRTFVTGTKLLTIYKRDNTTPLTVLSIPDSSNVNRIS